MLKFAVSLLSLFVLLADASNTVRRLLQIPSVGAGAAQPVVPMGGVAAGAGYGVTPGYGAYGGAATMGGSGVVPGYGAPAMGSGAVVPSNNYGAAAPGYGTGAGAAAGNGPQAVVPYGGVAPPPGYQWVLGLEPLAPGQVVPGYVPEYVQPGSEG